MTIPVFVCVRCPMYDPGAFYTKELGKFMEHLHDQHDMFPGQAYWPLPLEELRGVPRCRSCGEEIDPKMFDGWCGPCFMAKWGD